MIKYAISGVLQTSALGGRQSLTQRRNGGLRFSNIADSRSSSLRGESCFDADEWVLGLDLKDFHYNAFAGFRIEHFLRIQ